MSASIAVTLPLVLMSADKSVSVKSTDSDVTVGTSFEPVILIVTLPLAVPSWLTTVNSSLMACPSVNSLCAVEALYVQAPSVPTLNVP